MGAVVALDRLLETRRVWRGRQQSEPVAEQPTGHAALDALLPAGGWQLAALNEILLGQPGSGELQLLWPLLARLTQAGERVVLVGAPAIPFAPAWQAAGVVLAQVTLLQVSGAERLWAAEQCLRSGSCGAVLCWPEQADDRALRRLQVAADSGQTLAFVLRDRRAADNPSPAALRLLQERQPWRVLKCRGGMAPARPVCISL